MTSSSSWIILLLGGLVVEGGIALLLLDNMSRTLDRIREGTDPERIARRYER